MPLFPPVHIPKSIEHKSTQQPSIRNPVIKERNLLPEEKEKMQNVLKFSQSNSKLAQKNPEEQKIKKLIGNRKILA